MTKPRATWVLWVQGWDSKEWHRAAVVTALPNPVASIGGMECLYGVVERLRCRDWRILPSGRKPRGAK